MECPNMAKGAKEAARKREGGRGERERAGVTIDRGGLDEGHLELSLRF